MLSFTSTTAVGHTHIGTIVRDDYRDDLSFSMPPTIEP